MEPHFYDVSAPDGGGRDLFNTLLVEVVEGQDQPVFNVHPVEGFADTPGLVLVVQPPVAGVDVGELLFGEFGIDEGWE